MPGGVVDPGETPHRAAVRGALEEIGVHTPLLPDVAATLEDLRMGRAGAVRRVTRQLDLSRVPL